MAELQSPLPLYLERVDDKVPHNFVAPTKQINSGQDVSTFLTSKAYRDITQFVLQLNRAVFPKIISGTGTGQNSFQSYEIGSSSVQFSETVLQLRQLLAAIGNVIDEVPLDTGPRRYGNLSFRKWYELVEDRATVLLEQYLPSHVLSFSHSSEVDALVELRSYFLGSFGSAQRLDYGTGHELSFLAFLAGIWKLGGFPPSNSGQEERGIVFGIIEPYVK
jgi:serine/threonine-protein phosphatase 2A activator